MTIEEKRAVIKENCDSYRLCYDGCHLYDNADALELEEDYDCPDAPDDKIIEFYDFLYGNAPTAHDPVNNPSHYTQGGMECIDEMLLIFGKEAVKHFCLCNAWKYRKRALFKNGQEDIDKSDWYIAKYKELEGA